MDFFLPPCRRALKWRAHWATDHALVSLEEQFFSLKKEGKWNSRRKILPSLVSMVCNRLPPSICKWRVTEMEPCRRRAPWLNEVIKSSRGHGYQSQMESNVRTILAVSVKCNAFFPKKFFHVGQLVNYPSALKDKRTLFSLYIVLIGAESICPRLTIELLIS